MLPVFENLFEGVGAQLEERVTLTRSEILARHFWSEGGRLDLHANLDQSYEAIRQFTGQREADGFLKFHKYAQAIYESVQDVFIYAPKPSPMRVIKQLGLSVMPRMLKADVQRTMWRSLKRFFRDPRLLQLFGRYATYAGNNPFICPATFNLIANVEQQGVWRVKGGIKALADAIADLVIERGGELQTNCHVDEILINEGRATGVRLSNGEELHASSVIFNGDVQALSQGALGDQARAAVRPYPAHERSLSALTLCAAIDARHAPLSHHNVFFSDDYYTEFAQLESGHLPDDPTLYLCAQHRGDESLSSPVSPDQSRAPHFEPALALVNAPATADYAPLSTEELDQCKAYTLSLLERHQITPDPQRAIWRTPRGWSSLFPHSGGAIYGMASKKWDSTLRRPGAQTRVQGLYLTGGSVHPGAGVPMATLSGMIAASQLHMDSPLTAL
jgi:1-hydroxycarotenoid 3,4-desaturase